MEIETGAQVYFGSGAAGTGLVVDGVRITDQYPRAHHENGFVEYTVSDIPVLTLLSAKKVRYSKYAYPPGIDWKWAGSGRHFIKNQRRCERGIDPLSVSLAANGGQPRLPKTRAIIETRKEAEWLKSAMDDLATGKIKTIGGELHARVVFRDPIDGSKKYKWERVVGYGNPVYHAGPAWRAFAKAAGI